MHGRRSMPADCIDRRLHEPTQVAGIEVRDPGVAVEDGGLDAIGRRIAPGLDQHHPAAAVRREPVREDAARRPAADDGEIDALTCSGSGRESFRMRTLVDWLHAAIAPRRHPDLDDDRCEGETARAPATGSTGPMQAMER